MAVDLATQHTLHVARRQPQLHIDNLPGRVSVSTLFSFNDALSLSSFCLKISKMTFEKQALYSISIFAQVNITNPTT
jgi:hypothetical protein